MLLFILRTHLRQVRSNRLWPDVAAEIEELSLEDIDAELCAEHFRTLLRRFRSDRIAELGTQGS